MNPKLFKGWFSVVSGILVLAGIVFSFCGLAILPVDQDVLLPWQSALYGAIMMGWGITLFFVGRLAFRRNDAELMKSLLYGLFVWLIVEALFSLYFGVFFNIGVCIAVLTIRHSSNTGDPIHKVRNRKLMPPNLSFNADGPRAAAGK